MTSPTDETVGRISVLLGVDATGAREEAQREVDLIEDSLDDIEVSLDLTFSDVASTQAEATAIARSLAREVSFDIDFSALDALPAAATATAESLSLIFSDLADLDLSSPFDDVDRSLRDISSTAAHFSDGIDGATHRVVDLRDATREVSVEAGRVAQFGSDAFARFEASAGGVTDRIRGARDELSGLSRELVLWKPNLPVLVTVDEVSEKTTKERLREAFNRISAEVITTINTSSRVAAAVQLAALTRARIVELVPKVSKPGLVAAVTQLNKLSGLRLVTNEVEKMRAAWARIDEIIPTIAMLTTSIVGLVGWLGSAVSNLLSLSASIAQIGPLFLALPAVFAAVGIGVGVLVAAFKDFNTVLPSVKGQLSTLQDLLSGAFWEQARAPMQAFFDSFLASTSAFSIGIQGTATALGGLFASLATSLAGLNVAPMFANLNDAIDRLTAVSGPLANIIQLLGEAGSNILPRLADTTAKWVGIFEAWLEGKGVSGLTDMFNVALDQVGELFRALGGLGNILAGLGKAALAGGGSTLTTFADALDHIAEIVNSEPFQSTLIDFFAAAHTAMENIAQISGPAVTNMFLTIADTISTVLPLVGDTIGVVFREIAKALADPALQEGFKQLIFGLSAGLQAIAPALGPIAGALGELATFIGGFASVLGPVLGTALTALAQSLVGVLPALNPIIDVLGGALINVIKTLAPVVLQLSTAFASLITGGFLPLIVSAIQGLLPAITQLAPILAGVILTAVQALAPIFPILGQILGQIAVTLGNLLVPLFIALSPILNTLITVIVNVVSALLPFVTIALDLINAVLVPLLPVIVDLINLALTPFLAALNFILPVVQLLGDLLLWVVETVIVPVIRPVIEWLAGFLDGELKGAIQAISDVFKTVWNEVKGVWDAFALLFKGDIGGFVSKIWETFKQFGKDVLQVFKDLTGDIGEKFLGFIKDIPNKIGEFLGGIYDTLYGIGKDILQGLLDGAKSMLSTVKGWFNDLTDWIPDWKGPLDKDKKLLTPAGKAIMDSLLRGMESRYGSVRQSLGGLSDDIAATQFGLRFGNLSGMLAAASAASGSSRTLNYYAAPGSSINSEEDLFDAAGRARSWF